MVTWEEYLQLRERYQMFGRAAESGKDFERAEYCTGVIRGLDLAFDVTYELAKEAK